MIWWKALILGLIQGLTEFLPISSSGHLTLAEGLMGITESNNFFNVVLHLATLLAVIIVFWPDVKALLRHPFSRTGRLLIVATIPTCVLAVCFKLLLSEMFTVTFLGFGFLVSAMLLLVTTVALPRGNATQTAGAMANLGAHTWSFNTGAAGAMANSAENLSAMPYKQTRNMRAKKCAKKGKLISTMSNARTVDACAMANANAGKSGTMGNASVRACKAGVRMGNAGATGQVGGADEPNLTFGQAIMVGISQGIAVLPGITRSGATICTGQLMGASREDALRFSFLLSIPVIIASMVYELIGCGFHAPAIGFVPVLIGSVVAFAAALVSIRAMLKLARRGNWLWFSVYLFVLSSLVLTFTFAM